MRWAAALLLTLPLTAFAAGTTTREFVEERGQHTGESAAYKDFLKKQAGQNLFLFGLRSPIKQMVERISVSGFISAAPIAEIATMVGPDVLGTSFRYGDNVFLRWTGSPGPRVGDRYHSYTPALVLQNALDPTDFLIRLPPKPGEELPKNFRLAGYFYESTSTLRVTRIAQGVIEAMIENMTGQLSIGDHLMPLLPKYAKVEPITGGIQLAAAIVAGSPADRLSTTKGSIVYINRGARDGMKVGRVFEAVETVKTDDIGAIAPELSVGEAKVIYVSDSYSTAVITEQFDVIRIGSLLKTKQEFAPAVPKKMFRQESQDVAPVSEPEVPAATSDSVLSELDALERSQEIRGLTPAEKERLDRLSRQQKDSGALSPVPVDEGLDALKGGPAPSLPPSDNSFKSEKPQAKKTDPKKAKKKKKASDEEELNMLMMQN